MSRPRKRRFPKKKPVDEFTTEEVVERIFPKKVAETLKKIAHDESPEEEDGDNSSDTND